MDIRPGGELPGVVPEQLPDLLFRDAPAEQDRPAGVPERVQPNRPSDPGPLTGHPDDAVQVSRVEIRVGMGFGYLAKAYAAQGDVRRAANFWGAGERLDSELGPTQWRSDKPEVEAALTPVVLADEEGIAAGKALPTAEAVELVLQD